MPALVQVKKAEGTQPAQWWTHRPPTDVTLEQLQRMAASKLAAAAAVGVSSGVTGAAATAANDSNPQAPSPKVQASDGAAQSSTTTTATSSSSSASSKQDASISSATMEVIQQWILAEVGLAAQRQLSQPSMRPVTGTDAVRAADGAQEWEGAAASPPLVTAAVTAEGADAQDQATSTVSNQLGGSKNQDPGILVDVSAVTRPGETRASLLNQLSLGQQLAAEDSWSRLTEQHAMTGVQHTPGRGQPSCVRTVGPSFAASRVHQQTCDKTPAHGALPADIRVHTTGDSSDEGRSAAPQDLQQPLSPAAAQRANEEPGEAQPVHTLIHRTRGP